jgi:serine/threonine-protein kinase RsbW
MSAADGVLQSLRWQRTFEGSLEQLVPIRDFARRAAGHCSGSAEDAFACELACDEAAANIFNHAFAGKSGRIEMQAWCSDLEFPAHGALIIQLRYRGKAFDPSRVREPDLAAPLEERPTGGLGLYFMRQLMDKVSFEFDPVSGNLLTMRRILNLPERYGNMELASERPTPETAVVHVQGSVDGSNFRKLIACAQELYADGARNIILDLGACEYMSSSGLVSLNAIAKLLRGETPPDMENASGWAVLKTLDDARAPTGKSQLVLVNPTTRVDRVLDLAGLKNMIPIYPDTASALAGLA